MSRFAALKRQQRDVAAATALAEPSQATPSRIRKPERSANSAAGEPVVTSPAGEAEAARR